MIIAASETAPSLREALNFSAEEALATMAFGDCRALRGSMHKYPQLWPKATELWKSFGIVTTDFEYDSGRRLAAHFRAKLDAGVDFLVTSGDITKVDGAKRADERFAAFCELLHGARQEWQERETQVSAARRALCDAAVGGKLTIFGRRGSFKLRSFSNLEHEAIPSTFFLLERRSISLDGWTTFLHSTKMNVLVHWREQANDSPDYGDLRFRRGEILALIETPQPTPGNGQAVPANGGEVATIQPETTQERTRRGGAPPTYDWPVFCREAIRCANLDSFETRRQMRDHMTEWVATNWPRQPDDSTLRRKLRELYPTDLPET